MKKKFIAVYWHETKGWQHVIDNDFSNKKDLYAVLRGADYKKITILSEKEIEYIVTHYNDDDYFEKTTRYEYGITRYIMENFKNQHTKNSVIPTQTENFTEDTHTTEKPEQAKEQEANAKSTKNSVNHGKIICKIDIIAELKKAGYNTSRIRKEKIIAECTLTELRKGIIRKIDTLTTICNITGLGINDIIEYIPTNHD